MKDSINFEDKRYDKEELKAFADSIELYLEELETIMIIPKDIVDKEGEKIKANIELAKELVKKIRKGKNVFKDPDEWDSTFDDL